MWISGTSGIARPTPITMTGIDWPSQGCPLGPSGVTELSLLFDTSCLKHCNFLAPLLKNDRTKSPQIQKCTTTQRCASFVLFRLSIPILLMLLCYEEGTEFCKWYLPKLDLVVNCIWEILRIVLLLFEFDGHRLMGSILLSESFCDSLADVLSWSRFWWEEMLRSFLVDGSRTA